MISGRTLLVIDDDDDVRAIVVRRLEAAGFDVVQAGSGADGVAKVTSDIATVLLDVGLPDVDGFSVLRSIRQRSDVPVLMVTGAGDEADRVLGLELGADDYVTKPFSERELVARVRAAIRRYEQPAVGNAPTLVRVGNLTVDPVACEASVGGEPVELRLREFDLLHCLAESPRQVFTRDQLLRHVWRSEPGWINDATVTEHIRRVRRALDEHPTAGVRIVTRRGLGYTLVPSTGR